MTRLLAGVARHQLVLAVVAGVAALVSVALYPGDVWAWIVLVLAAAWIVVTLKRIR